VADPAPEIDDLLAAVINAARATQLSEALEVLLERLADPLEAGMDFSFY